MSQAIDQVVNDQGLAVPTQPATGLESPAWGPAGHIGRISIESDITNDTDGDSISSYNPTGDITNGPAFVRYDPDKKAQWDTTQVDIIGIPAVGADPRETWTANLPDTSEVETNAEGDCDAGDAQGAFSPASPVQTETSRPSTRSYPPIWIVHDVRTAIPKARVILYDHGDPEEGVTLKHLAEGLLRCLRQLREPDKKKRPLFLVCHSTGGLVAKLALTIADRGGPEDKSLVADCFGISFFATPHKGSSYLSSPAFTTSIQEAMHLRKPLPKSLQRHFEVNDSLLRSISSDFRLLAGDLKIWTFYETQDTDLTPGTNEVRLLAPITSIKSAILELYHEVDYPLLTDHVGCASFSGKNNQTKQDYLAGLKEAVEKACGLSSINHNELKLREKVKVEIHGFYEDSTPQSPGAKPPIRLCSTRRTLKDFKEYGPSKCLADRLKELSGEPRTLGKPRHNQYLRSRALSLAGTVGGSGSTTLTQTTKIAPPGHSANLPSQKGHDPQTRTSLTRPRSRSRFRRRSSQAASARDSSPPVSPTHPPIKTSLDRVSREAVPDVIVRGPDDEGQSPESPRGHPLDYYSTAPATTAISPAGTNDPSGDMPAGFTKLSKSAQSGEEQIGDTNRQSLLSPNSKPFRSTQRPGERGRERRGSNGSDELAVSQFTGSRKLTWVHMPFNNPPWVSDVLEIVAIDRGEKPYERILDPQNWASKHVRIRRSEHHACFVKPGCLLISPESHVTSPPITPITPSPAGLQISLYLPYLHWDTYKLLVDRRYLLKKRLSRGRCRPVPEEVSNMDLEHRVTWAFLGHDPPFNCRRTLDQFGYPSLHDTRARDDDQMLYKMTKKRRKLHAHASSPPQQSAETDEDVSDDEPQKIRSHKKVDGEGGDSVGDLLDGTVLMVDQLWLWIISDQTTVTFFPRRQSRPTEGRLYRQADLRNSIYNEVNGDLGRRCENSFELAALVTLHAVTVLFEHSSHSDLEVFRIFEESISILTEKMTKSFKDFRLQGFRDKRFDYDSDNHKIGIKERHKREAKVSEKQNRDDTSAMLELRDIDDELNTLEKLFKQQTETIHQMKDIYRKSNYALLSGHGLTILNEALEKLKEYSDQVKQMIESANRTRKDFEKLLNLKQRQANVDEARLARYHADLASMQSRAVMIFTVFSVIFLPLTFFTGLFGMNISEWTGDRANTSWHTVIKLSIPVSFAIILIALAIALSTTIRKSPKRLAEGIRDLSDRISSKGSADKGDVEDSDDVDFWEGHVDRRENRYEIPTHNMNVKEGVGMARGGRRSGTKGRMGGGGGRGGV
ncbi:MAG: hypothetical protein M1839_004568 [Geoglossum umbratile]|nr:MAG: hypothetical protein M1839_004568 [Geoglossum umbratile]